VDLFRCESILLRSHWVLVVIDVCTRRIIGFGIGGEYIDGPAVCRMFNQAIAGHAPPVRISTDHDPLFRFHRWLANLRILEVEEIKSVPYAPTSHPFVERLIGTIRREYLDHTFFWNSIDPRPPLPQRHHAR
jgi:transposase InsO family protein